MSLKDGGVGLNLTAASNVFLMVSRHQSELERLSILSSVSQRLIPRGDDAGTSSQTGAKFFYKEPSLSIVERNGVQFVLDGRPFYVNGWNSYWLMDNAVEDHSRPRVRAMLQAGSKMGLTVCRTWAFNDGSLYHALQISPGQFDEKVFKALDYVAEAWRSGVRLILSLVNNLAAYGKKGLE
ncbi:hypothetical protein Droror1_Dr00020789 [Drosera rotundifolia]